MPLKGGTKNTTTNIAKKEAEMSMSTPKGSKTVTKIMKNGEKQLKLKATQLIPSSSKGENMQKCLKKKREPRVTNISKPVKKNNSKPEKEDLYKESPIKNSKLTSIGKKREREGKCSNRKVANKSTTTKTQGSKLKSKSYFPKKGPIIPKPLQPSISTSPVPGPSHREDSESEINNPILQSFLQRSTTTSPVPGPSSKVVVKGSGKKVREGMIVSPRDMRYILNAHKHSPIYPEFQKLKRFNTRYGLPPLPKNMEINLFTPEELDALSENPLPEIENRMNVTVPGEKYAHIFKDIPIDTYDDSFQIQEENKMLKELCKNRRRGRPRMIGYRGVPFSDEALERPFWGGNTPPPSPPRSLALSSGSGKKEKPKKNNRGCKSSKAAVLRCSPSTSADKKNTVCSNIVGSLKRKNARNKGDPKVPASKMKPAFPNIQKTQNIVKKKSAMIKYPTIKVENEIVSEELSATTTKFKNESVIQSLPNTLSEGHICTTLLPNEKPINNMVLRVFIPKELHSAFKSLFMGGEKNE